MQFVETNTKSFTNGAVALVQYARVKLVSDLLVVAGATDREIGVARTAMAIGEVGTVHLRTANGTVPMVANGAILSGAKVYGAAAGKISATQAAGASLVGTALQAASGDGSLIEVLRDAHETAT